MMSYLLINDSDRTLFYSLLPVQFVLVMLCVRQGALQYNCVLSLSYIIVCFILLHVTGFVYGNFCTVVERTMRHSNQ